MAGATRAAGGESRWKSADRMESFVRGALTSRTNFFENHWIDLRGYGEYLPVMTATIPGQFDEGGHGIDIFAMDSLDPERSLWVIEVSRGTPGGAGTFKGAGRRVKYAGGELQMSAAWREAAARKFLGRSDAPDKIRHLLDVAEKDDGRARSMFWAAFQKHKKAIVVPEGCHFDTRGTDIDFRKEVYTFRSAAGSG